MRHQQDTATYDIFDPRFLARSDDPETSHEAAERVGEFAAGHHRKILAVLRRHPLGLTAYEIADHCDLEPHAIGKRLGEMERLHMIRQSLNEDGAELTRKTPSGRSARVWVAA